VLLQHDENRLSSNDGVNLGTGPGPKAVETLTTGESGGSLLC
jgi:hypothetical protein